MYRACSLESMADQQGPRAWSKLFGRRPLLAFAILTFVLNLATAPGVAVAAKAPTTTSTTATTTTGGGAVLNFSRTAQLAFVLSVAGVFAALWFVLLLYDRVSAARWRRSPEYSQLLGTLFDKALPRNSTSTVSVDEVRLLANAVNQPPRGATGLTRSVLAFGLLTLVAVALVVLLVGNSSNAGDLLKTVVTALLTALTTIIGFYFGAKTATDAANPPAARGREQHGPARGLPSAPTGVTATPGDADAVVSFTPPSDTGGSPITSYTATSSPDGLTGTSSGGPITVAGLRNDKAYAFTVRATNASGDSHESDPSEPVTPRAATPSVPGAPTDVVATAGEGSAIVSFTPPADQGGAPITSYTATSDPGGTTGTSTGGPITVEGLTSGTSYTFTVHATNSAGDSPESHPSPPITP